MKANEDKQLEKLVDRMMKDRVLETPSIDFTSQVMSQVLATQKSEITTYKPLISTPVFILIFSSLTFLIAYVLLNGNSSSATRFLNLNFTVLANLNPTRNFHFSEITTYSVVLTTIMLCIQIPLLKNYFDSRYNI
jgi:hypothetical protein